MIEQGARAALPRHWPEHVSQAMVQVIALAHTALTVVRGWCVDSRTTRVRLASENERLRAEVALLRRENELLCERFLRVPSRSRPHYTPTERLQALSLKAARHWNASQLAKRLMLSPSTVLEWMDRLSAKGEQEFLKLPDVVNRFPDFVGAVARELKVHFPHLGKVKVQQLLARAGLHLAVSTVGRMLRGETVRRPPRKPGRQWAGTPVVEAAIKDEIPGAVTAKRPNHVWHVDITVVPTALGFWAPWWPFSVPTRWPFSWHVGLVVDHYSRRMLTCGVFSREPSSAQVCDMLDRAEQDCPFATNLPTHLH